MIDAVTEFTDAMASHGIFVTENVREGFHRYQHRDDRRGKRNVWAILHTDGKPNGVFGDYKRLGPDAKIKWSGKGAAELTPQEREEMRRLSKESAARREQKRREEHAAAAARANAIWKAAAECSEHPYLKRKKVGSYGLRTADWVKEYTDPETGEVTEKRIKNALLIPIRNDKKEIASLQAIFPNDKNATWRDRDFLSGGEKKGCWFTIGNVSRGDPKPTICITEGYATGASVHAATGFCTLVAFDCGNLAPVARKAREMLPNATIVVCADNDQWTDRNPGVLEAEHAALAVGGIVVVPQFANVESKPTDWNDLALLAGSEEVKRQIDVVLHPVSPSADIPQMSVPADMDDGETSLDPEPKKKRERRVLSDAAATEMTERAAAHFTILGYDKNDVYFYSRKMKQVISARRRDLKSEMIPLAPLEWWQREFNADGHGGQQAWRDMAQNWMMRAAEVAGFYSGETERGRGAWIDGGRIVYHFGDHLMVDAQQTELGPLPDSKYCYSIRNTMPSIDVEPLSDEEGLAILKIAQAFRWQKEASGPLLAGWCALAPLGGALQWRPHIWINGGPGAGKTTVLGRFVKPLMNGTAIFVDGGTTAAGVRARLDSDALPILFDESETTSDKEAIKLKEILTMARGAASESGAVTLKGTATGGYITTTIRSMFCLSSIAVAIERQADYERFTILTLRPKKEGVSGKEAAAQWDAIDKSLSEMGHNSDLPRRLMRRSVDLMPTTLANIKTFSRAAAEKFGSQREGDQYGALMAGAWSLVSKKLASPESARKMLDRYDWNDYLENAEEESSGKVLSTILQQMIRVNGTLTLNMYELLTIACGARKDVASLDANAALDIMKRHGVTIKECEGKQFLCVSNNPQELLRMIKDTPYHTDLRSHLLLCKGARKFGTVRFGVGTQKCVGIPLDCIVGEDEPVVDREPGVELEAPW